MSKDVVDSRQAGTPDSDCSQFPFAALRQAKICMAEIADKCITDAVVAKDEYAKWASQERAKTIRADIAAIEKLELDWCNGAITANDRGERS